MALNSSTQPIRPRKKTPTSQRSTTVCHIVGSIGHGGRESLLEEIIQQSPEHIAYVVCGMQIQDGYDDRFEQIGVETVSFDAESKRDIGALVRMARFLYNRNFDILHAHGPNAQIPCRFLAPIYDSSLISTVHGVPNMFPDRILQLERLTRGLEARTIAVSQGVKYAFVGKNETRQWETIQNGIAVESFNRAVKNADPSIVRERYSVPEQTFTYLNIGRYVPPKSQLDLVEAMKYVVSEQKDVHLFIVGGRGAMEGRIRDRVAEYGLKDYVTVTGRVDEIYPFYAVADLFVSSSVGEGLPIVQMEAMAAELPVIATDIPGVRELVIDDETGVLVPTESPERLGAAMLELADHHECNQYGQAGYDRVLNEFHIRDTVNKYISIYKELVDSEVTDQ